MFDQDTERNSPERRLRQQGSVMPKQKSHSGIKKKVRLTGTGKIVHAGTAKRHHLEIKPTKRTRRSDGMQGLAKADVPRVKRMLGI